MIKLNQGIPTVSSVPKKSDAATERVEKPTQSEGTATKLTANSSANNISVPSGDIDFAARQTRNDQLNNIATNIRSINTKLDNVENLFKEKRQEISEYEKQYPPFQDQSSEKVEFLNSISSLKKQVDALTIVPDNSGVNLSLVNSEQADHTFEEETSEEASFQLPQQLTQLSSDENGLKIASISTTASDEEISQFSRDLETSNKILGEKRIELEKETKLISDGLVSQDKTIGKQMLESEQEAISKSEEITKVLTALPNESIAHEQGQTLLESLR